ncbi:MAG: hypothetical protein ACKO4Y_09515 [Flavobacteriales bacterium]
MLTTPKIMLPGSAADAYLFRVPTLRNIEYSFPYMHDGRMTKLKEVIHHYANSSNWVHPISNALKLKNNSLSPEAEKELLKFLKTLTDKEFLFNPSFRYKPK